MTPEQQLTKLKKAMLNFDFCATRMDDRMSNDVHLSAHDVILNAIGTDDTNDIYDAERGEEAQKIVIAAFIRYLANESGIIAEIVALYHSTHEINGKPLSGADFIQAMGNLLAREDLI